MSIGNSFSALAWNQINAAGVDILGLKYLAGNQFGRVSLLNRSIPLLSDAPVFHALVSYGVGMNSELLKLSLQQFVPATSRGNALINLALGPIATGVATGALWYAAGFFPQFVDVGSSFISPMQAGMWSAGSQLVGQQLTNILYPVITNTEVPNIQ